METVGKKKQQQEEERGEILRLYENDRAARKDRDERTRMARIASEVEARDAERLRLEHEAVEAKRPVPGALPAPQ